jgi:hypothetical protein
LCGIAQRFDGVQRGFVLRVRIGIELVVGRRIANQRLTEPSREERDVEFEFFLRHGFEVAGDVNERHGAIAFALDPKNAWFLLSEAEESAHVFLDRFAERSLSGLVQALAQRHG